VVRSVGFSPDSRRIVSASGPDVRIWDTESDQELACLRAHKDASYSHNDTVYCVVFAPDDERILSGSADQAVCIWGAASSKLLTRSQDPSAADLVRSFTQDAAVLSIAWSPDGRFVVAGLRNGAVRLWDVEGGRLIASLLGHSDSVHAVAYAPDGRRVVSGSHDGTVRVWNTNGGRELAPLRAHTSYVTQVRFTAQGERILTIATDSTIRLWDAHTGEQLSCLRGEDEKLASKDRNWHSDVASLTRWYCSPDEWNLAFETSYESSHPDHFLVWNLQGQIPARSCSIVGDDLAARNGRQGTPHGN
jgi:WD40 repeat protein